MKESKLLVKGIPYSENTIKTWINFHKIWNRFCLYRKKDFKIFALTEEDYHLFLVFCDISGFSLTTKKLYSSILKTILMENGGKSIKTTNDFYLENHVYLSENEIGEISRLDLADNCYLQKIRDVFLIGYYTGQRFSDYKALTSNDIVTLEHNGCTFSAIRIRQKKTKSQITVPILNMKIITILDHWGGRLPGISHSGFNRGIKEICKRAGISQNVVITRSKGGRIATEALPKWQLISSHSARRSCITNLYLSGKLSELQIRSISGHTTSRSFKRYICCNDEENIYSIMQSLCSKETSN